MIICIWFKSSADKILLKKEPSAIKSSRDIGKPKTIVLIRKSNFKIFFQRTYEFMNHINKIHTYYLL